MKSPLSFFHLLSSPAAHPGWNSWIAAECEIPSLYLVCAVQKQSCHEKYAQYLQRGTNADDNNFRNTVNNVDQVVPSIVLRKLSCKCIVYTNTTHEDYNMAVFAVTQRVSSFNSCYCNDLALHLWDCYVTFLYLLKDITRFITCLTVIYFAQSVNHEILAHGVKKEQLRLLPSWRNNQAYINSLVFCTTVTHFPPERGQMALWCMHYEYCVTVLAHPVTCLLLLPALSPASLTHQPTVITCSPSCSSSLINLVHGTPASRKLVARLFFAPLCKTLQHFHSDWSPVSDQPASPVPLTVLLLLWKLLRLRPICETFPSARLPSDFVILLLRGFPWLGDDLSVATLVFVCAPRDSPPADFCLHGITICYPRSGTVTLITPNCDCVCNVVLTCTPVALV